MKIANSTDISWILLLFAGIMETIWMISLKETEGFRRPLPVVGFALSAILSIWFLSKAMKNISMGTSYAVWSGMGLVGTAVFGMAWYREQVCFTRVLYLLLILIGIIGLKMSEKN
jgi:quaternary ammonium compound-resistance protein SugE